MTLFDEEWGVLANLLPPNWRELAHESGAMQRSTGISDPGTLLQLLLMHASTGLSLRQTVARAREQGLASISDVALLKRLRSSGDWLASLTRAMFRDSRFGRNAPDVGTRRRIRVVDATNVQEPGATGTSWRVHYSMGLPDLACDHFEVTDVSGGETYKRFPLKAGDIIMGDRGYAHRGGAAHVVTQGADFVVRPNHHGFPLLNGNGKKFNVVAELRKLKGYKAREWAVSYVYEGATYPARLCVIRKSKEAAARAKQKLQRERGPKVGQLQPSTFEMAEYIAVLTSLPVTECSTTSVLELYRARWQVELAFKRLKSLLQLGHVPKSNSESARAWLEAKMLTVLLIERLLEGARFISPWGHLISTT